MSGGDGLGGLRAITTGNRETGLDGHACSHSFHEQPLGGKPRCGAPSTGEETLVDV
jgi:hypothetical protein